jgi:hypothetical protein
MPVHARTRRIDMVEKLIDRHRQVDDPWLDGTKGSATLRPMALRDRIICDGTFRRFLFFAAVAFWLGGFTFYSAVVIHVGTRVLGSHVKQGLITQRVTEWLNVAGAVALPVMLWNARAVWAARGRALRLTLAATWAIMALVQAELFALHPTMDRLIDGRAVLDVAAFDRLHVAYLTSATVQWAAGLVHVWCALSGAEV